MTSRITRQLPLTTSTERPMARLPTPVVVRTGLPLMPHRVSTGLLALAFAGPVLSCDDAPDLSDNAAFVVPSRALLPFVSFFADATAVNAESAAAAESLFGAPACSPGCAHEQSRSATGKTTLGRMYYCV